MINKTGTIFRSQKLDRFSVLKTGPFFAPAGQTSLQDLFHFSVPKTGPFFGPKNGTVFCTSWTSFLRAICKTQPFPCIVFGAVFHAQKGCSCCTSWGCLWNAICKTVLVSDIVRGAVYRQPNGQIFIQCVLVLLSHFSQSRATLGCELVANSTRQCRCFLGSKDWFVGHDEI